MGRWMPDAMGRMTAAALELFAEHGYDETTVSQIAERAGVTERTFFRYFADKREVLFKGGETLQARAVTAIADAPAEATAFDAVRAGMVAAADAIGDDNSFSRRRAGVIAANTSLLERELLKMAALGAACAEALRARGVAEPGATLIAESGVTMFRVAFERWIAGEASASGSLADRVREAFAELRAVAAG